MGYESWLFNLHCITYNTALVHFAKTSLGLPFLHLANYSRKLSNWQFPIIKIENPNNKILYFFSSDFEKILQKKMATTMRIVFGLLTLVTCGMILGEFLNLFIYPIFLYVCLCWICRCFCNSWFFSSGICGIDHNNHQWCWLDCS